VVLKKEYRVKPEEDKSTQEEESINSEKGTSTASGDNNDENENRIVDAKLLHEVIPIVSFTIYCRILHSCLLFIMRQKHL